MMDQEQGSVHYPVFRVKPCIRLQFLSHIYDDLNGPSRYILKKSSISYPNHYDLLDR